MKQPLLIQGGTLVTMDPTRRVFVGDIEIENTKISRMGRNLHVQPGSKVISAVDQFVIPGLIQAHTHLVQCLYRGEADDMSLIDWLQNKIWPMETAHSKHSIQASVRVALAEMQLLGTTSILDMATVRHTDSVLEIVKDSGMRYWGGKCLMDLPGSSGPLGETTSSALQDTHRLIEDWHNDNELIHYALCPRFAVSCSEELLKTCVQLQDRHGLLIHTHASESLEEIAIIKKRTGLLNVEYLDSIGFLNDRTVIVHGVHLTNGELNALIKNKTSLVHCPSSNLKLASGIAPIQTYLSQGLNVAVGSDGAPCNNTMDPFFEMRLSALLQKPVFGPEALPAQKALELLTRGGAHALSASDRIGSLEVGKQADIVLVRRDHPSVSSVQDAYSALVYSCSGRDVTNVFIAGKHVVKNGVHFRWKNKGLKDEAQKELKDLKSRAKKLALAR
jgi:5-methylthioadenosine/S-adenosylhomocysteine deaminase